MKIERNLVFHNADNLLLICENLNQMFDNFVPIIECLTEIERTDLASIFEGTNAGMIIEQINDVEKIKRKTKKVRKINRTDNKEINDMEENNNGKK